MEQRRLEQFAELAVRVGCNIQPDQILRVVAPVEMAAFAQLCVEAAYKAGAKYVMVDYRDEITKKLHFDYASTETLCEVPQYKLEEMNYMIDSNIASLTIFAETPGLLKDVDPQKMQASMMAFSQKMKPIRDYFMGNHGQWCIISVPTVGWATKVFPELSPEAAIEKLWDAILLTVRVDGVNDPVAAWHQHNEKMATNNQKLNDYNFKYLKFKNSLGTDLTLYLAEGHRWCGGSELSTKGVRFNPNIPTEESFSMPFKTKVDGKVVATKPLSYQGQLIEDFYLVFKDGKVVEYDAKGAKDTLTNLLQFDEGSSYLGEVALISHDSPISNINLLFYNTLFDENASCHLALGAAYPMNIKDHSSYTEEELFAKGMNKSMEHEDFMFGSACMQIYGVTFDDQEVQIFKDGNFII
jgi:aminopeptidase